MVVNIYKSGAFGIISGSPYGVLDKLREEGVYNSSKVISFAKGNDGNIEISYYYGGRGIVPDTDPDLVGWWKFNEGSGTMLTDWSGNSNHGTILSGTWTAGSGRGTKPFFSGDHGHVRVLSGATLDMGSTTDFSISMWFKNTTWENLVQVLAGKGRAAGVKFTFVLRATNGALLANANDGVDTSSAPGNIAANDGEWHHAVAVYDRDGVISVYLDAVLDTTDDMTAVGDINNDENFLIGFNDGSKYFIGYFDDVRLYRRALTVAEIRKIYNQTKI